MLLFTLFNKDEIHENAGNKILPAKDFETLLDASSLLEKVKIDTKEQIKKTNEECKQIKQDAYDEGYQEGLEKLNTIILKIDHELNNLEDNINKKVLPIALKAAKKILGEELKIHPDRIVEIVTQSLKPITDHYNITIYVNKDDFEILDKKKGKIKKMLNQAKTFSIQERSDIEQGGCIIETEAGIINAQLENQWRALEAAFEKYTKK